MVIYEKARLKVAEFYFDEQEQNSAADMVRFHFRPAPIPGAVCTDRHTTELNLDQSLAALHAGMNKETRYEIRRAEKEKISTEFTSTPDRGWMESFIEFYDRFAPTKRLPTINRPRVEALHREGYFNLSRALSEDGTALVYHAYIRMGNRARLFHSGSLFRAMDKPMAACVGRANRLLHWADIQHYREQGAEIYDLGGWYAGGTDPEKLAVNRFKESFGGSVVRQFDSDRLITWKATAVWQVRNLVHAVSGRFR